jgi:hypothetical protein
MGMAVMVPWPISAPGDIKVTTPSRPMLIQLLGPKPLALGVWAKASSVCVKPKDKPKAKPPEPRMNERRETWGVEFIGFMPCLL